jgi:hypothetical protein
MGQITINKEPAFHEIFHEGHVEHEGKYHHFWLVHRQGLDVNGHHYEIEIRWLFSRVPREVRALYPQIIETFKQTL